MKKTLIALVALLTLAAVPVSAQTYLTSTTLNGSITATQTQIRVASATNVQANGGFYIDHEFMPVVSVSGTLVTVVRNQRPTAHGSGAVVLIASAANRAFTMLTTNGAQRAGQCSTSTSSSAATALAGINYLPIIDIDTGNVYNCRRVTGGLWLWTYTNVQGLNALDGSVPTAWP